MAEPPVLHPAAAEGFSASADVYVRGRPDYPPALDGWLREHIGIGPGRTVVDLGAGTGKFTGHLRSLGAQVIAVEPVAEMRAQLSRLYPDVDARAGAAEAIPVEDAMADVVTCAQAFHWFATPEAMREIRRVLKPGGALALIWNMRDVQVDWVAGIEAIMAPYEGDTPRYGSGLWRRLFPAEGFGALEEAHFPNVHEGPPERVIVDRVLSTSFIAALPAKEREHVAARVRALIAGTPALRGRDHVAFPYRLAVYAARKLD